MMVAHDEGGYARQLVRDQDVESTPELLSLLLSRVESVGENVSSIRQTVESVDNGTAKMSMRLDLIEQHLRESEARKAAAAASTPLKSGLLIPAAVLAWFLASQRGRRLLVRMPTALLVTLQLAAALSLAAVASARASFPRVRLEQTAAAHPRAVEAVR